MTSGKRAPLTINPSVPYFSDHRYQNNPEQRESVAATLAPIRDIPISAAPVNTLTGRSTQRIPAMRMLYTDSTGNRYISGAPRRNAFRAPVAKKSRASKPAFQSGDQKGIEGKFSLRSLRRKRNIA
jgi:hypothetical protein